MLLQGRCMELVGQKSVLKVQDMTIGNFPLMDFTIQLGDVREMHGFDGVLGSDFFLAYQW